MSVLKLTPAKLRYLITIAQLQRERPAVRCIDVAVRLGVARASVCRMLAVFLREGLLWQHPGKTIGLTEQGRIALAEYTGWCEKLAPLFSQMLGLTEYDAQECAMALVSNLPGCLLKTLCGRIQAAVRAAG